MRTTTSVVYYHVVYEIIFYVYKIRYISELNFAPLTFTTRRLYGREFRIIAAINGRY